MKYLIVLPTAVILLLIVGFVFLPISTFNPDAYQGNKLIDKEESYLAFRFYQSAEKAWPFLKYNLDFQNKYKKSIIARGEYLLSKPSLIVFLKDGVSLEDIKALVGKVEESEHVSRVEFISKERALQIYRDLNKDNPQLLELVTAEILPASIEIYLKNWEKQDEVVPLIKGSALVEEIVIPKQPL